MAKASLKLLKAILENRIDSKEINHVFTSIQFQDHSGTIEGGVDRKVISLDGAMSERHQYNVIDSLCKAGIYEKDGKNIRIPYNCFLDKDGKENYSQNNYIELPNFIHETKFLRASVQVKRFIIHLLICRALEQPVRIRPETMQEWLGVNRPSKASDISRELDNLGLFVIEDDKESNIIVYKLKREFTGTSRLKTSRNSENKVRNILKQKRLYKHVTPVAFRDLIQLYNEYKETFINCVKFLNVTNLKGALFRTIIRRHIAATF